MKITKEKLSAWGDLVAQGLLYAFALFGLMVVYQIVLGFLIF